MPRIFVPSSGPGAWRALLAEPDKQWARRYSARTLAHCWEDAEGFPIEVGRVLAQHSLLASAEPLLFGLRVGIGQLVSTTAAKGLPLHLAWVHGDERYLNA